MQENGLAFTASDMGKDCAGSNDIILTKDIILCYIMTTAGHDCDPNAMQ